VGVGEGVDVAVAVEDGVGVAVDPSSSPPQAANAGRSRTAKTRANARLTPSTEPSRWCRVNCGVPRSAVESWPPPGALPGSAVESWPPWGVAPGS
jgi:hypothetical protein